MTWGDPLVVIAAMASLAVVVIFALAMVPQIPGAKDLFVGVGTNPQVVALFRALLIYYLPGAVAAVTAYVNHWTDPRLLGLVPFALGILRLLEGRVDAWLKPKQNDVNPPPVAGGGGPGLLT
jgi:hypothetical protein